jgi:membrane fusion protein (multidrug efflux system)
MDETQLEIKTREKKKKGLPLPFIILVVLIIIGTIGSMIVNAAKYETTEDAYVETHTVNISPKVSGQIVEVFVTDNQQVKEGDLIAIIDDTDYQVKQSEANAKYDLTLYKQKGAKANYDAANSEIVLARKNLDRYNSLYNSGAASKLEVDNAKMNYDNVNAKLTQANENVLSSDNNRMADAELKQLSAQKKQAALNLAYTKIYAPQSGSIAGKNVEKGSFVQVGQPLCAIVPKNIWVVANFKESQLRNMKVGQEVDIKVDTYPNKEFKGKIDSIQRISGAKSSLFPPENAVGSFVKIVQRIPVKILFTEDIDENEYTIVPGMSVEPKVRIKK